MATHTIPLDTTRLLAILADADMKMIFGCLAIASIGSLVTWIVGLSIYNIFFHPLANVPGPFWGKISDFHRAWQIYTTGSELVVETELHKRYGPLVRQGPGIVILNTASMVPKVYHSKAYKSGFYNADLFGPGTPVPSMFHQDPKAHAVSRRRLNPAFTLKSVKAMEPIIQERVDEWIAINRRYADEGKEINWYDWCQSLAYDVVGDLVFGKKFGFVETESDVDNLLHSFYETVPLAGFIIRIPWLMKFISNGPLGPYILPNPKDKTGLGHLQAIRNKLIKDRIANPTDKPDVLNHILNYREADGSAMPIPLVESELIVILIGGNETTGATLCSFVQLLVENPHVYQKILAGDLSAENLARENPEFPYLKATLKEVNRYRHSAPNTFPRIVSKGGLVIPDGRFIPEGTEITMNIQLCMRDRTVWGEDADEFVPERWLDERARASEKNNFSWGYGPRMCLGKPVAELELLLATKALLENFVFDKETYVNPEKPYKRVTCYGTTVYEDFMIKLRKREGVV